MPPKTFTCVICGKTVTKPKSWSSLQIGLNKEGRVCRDHEEVRDAISLMQKEKEDQANWKKGE